MSPLGSDWQLCVVLQVWSESSQGSRKKLGEPCVGHPRTQEYARSIRLLSSGWHQKENRFLGSPTLFTMRALARWRQSYQGDNCDRAGLAELRHGNTAPHGRSAADESR